MKWKEQLTEKWYENLEYVLKVNNYPPRDRRRHITGVLRSYRSEIITKLIADIADAVKETHQGGIASLEEVKQQLRDKWL
jgi:hypothetical protein